ncbi:hypothetical protein K501DRAFT_338053 [Backusella circina FSU 941]|nr:hypothetical protein K501DRAFT_338053 [Backusella circina FSU 941]
MVVDAEKPRSMPSGLRNIVRSNDSASLWNSTLSPGWTEDESEMLRQALMKFGIGNWAKIIDSGCLPGKTNAQMNLQLQRLLGQQSTAEFAGLHIDPKVIGAKNSLIQGAHIRRKNNCIVNTGGKLSREELKRRVVENKKQFELPESDWIDIVLPKMEDPMALLNKKRVDLEDLKERLEKVQAKIEKMKEAHPNRMAKLKTEVNRSPSPGSASSPATPSTLKGDDDMDMDEGNAVDSSTKSSNNKKDANIDEDYALALALQKEEAGYSQESDDDDFVLPKKRKVTRRK